jgi:hypothetical protein
MASNPMSPGSKNLYPLNNYVDIFDVLNHLANADRGPEIQRGGDHRD